MACMSTRSISLRSSISAPTNIPSSRIVRNGKLAASKKQGVVCSANTPARTTSGALDLADTKFGELEVISPKNEQSFARQHYHPCCEAALNDQINTEYNVSYIYHSFYAYFNQDNVALPGLAQYFKDASAEEREHAEMMMEYQNLRGGTVALQSLIMPDIELGNNPQGDALYAMELTLALERLNNEKLLALHKVAEEMDDPQMTDYIEGTFLEDQVKAVREVSEYVRQLRRVGKGHGTYHWDLEFGKANAAAAAAAAA